MPALKINAMHETLNWGQTDGIPSLRLKWTNPGQLIATKKKKHVWTYQKKERKKKSALYMVTYEK